MSWIYLMKDDEFTCVFLQVDSEGLLQGDYPRWIDFKALELPASNSDRDFLTAAAVLTVGERSQRRVVERKIKKGTKNITSLIGRPIRYLGLARNPEGMVGDDRKEETKMIKEFQKELAGMIDRAREEVRWNLEVPSRWSYVVTDEVIDAATEAGCESYFKGLEGQRFFAADMVKIETAILEMCPESATGVVQVLKATKTDEHLSMISLSGDEKNALFVTVVDPKGHHLKVEAPRFVEMVDSHDQPRRLHVFPPRESRQPVSFAFNANSKGEIIGKFLPEQMKIDVVCCQGQGPYNVYDRAFFYLDPEYLMCLWVVLCRLEQDRNRFTQLKSFAEARVEFNPFAVGASL